MTQILGVIQRYFIFTDWRKFVKVVSKIFVSFSPIIRFPQFDFTLGKQFWLLDISRFHFLSPASAKSAQIAVKTLLFRGVHASLGDGSGKRPLFQVKYFCCFRELLQKIFPGKQLPVLGGRGGVAVDWVRLVKIAGIVLLPWFRAPTCLGSLRSLVHFLAIDALGSCQRLFVVTFLNMSTCLHFVIVVDNRSTGTANMNQIRDRKHEAMGHYTYAYACGLMGLFINYVIIYILLSCFILFYVFVCKANL